MSKKILKKKFTKEIVAGHALHEDHIYDKFFDSAVEGMKRIAHKSKTTYREMLHILTTKPDCSRVALMTIDFIKEVPESAMIFTGCFNEEQVELLIVECCVHTVSHLHSHNV